MVSQDILTTFCIIYIFGFLHYQLSTILCVVNMSYLMNNLHQNPIDCFNIWGLENNAHILIYKRLYPIVSAASSPVTYKCKPSMYWFHLQCILSFKIEISWFKIF